VCGGKDEDYYNIVEELKEMEVNELIEIVLAQREIDAMNDAKKQQNKKRSEKDGRDTNREKKLNNLK